MSPEELATWLDQFAAHLEFAHKTPAASFTFTQSLLNRMGPGWVDFLVAMSGNAWTAQEMSDELARIRAALPAEAAFLTSEASLAMAAKLRNLESRRLILDVLCRVFS